MVPCGVDLGAMRWLRQGEATGLSVDRPDLPRRILVVDRQLVTPIRSEPFLGPPKTATSYRTVPLADVARDYLTAHLERFGAGRDGLVLHEDGRPLLATGSGRCGVKCDQTQGCRRPLCSTTAGTRTPPR
jgi:hypothetical protein